MLAQEIEEKVRPSIETYSSHKEKFTKNLY